MYLGGSFDPVHNSHLALLTHVYRKLAADNHSVKAYFMPTSRSLKTNSSASEHRLKYVERSYRRDKGGCLIFSTYSSSINQRLVSTRSGKRRLPIPSIPWLNYVNSILNTAWVFLFWVPITLPAYLKWRDGDKLTQFTHLWVFLGMNYSLLKRLLAIT